MGMLPPLTQTKTLVTTLAQHAQKPVRNTQQSQLTQSPKIKTPKISTNVVLVGRFITAILALLL